MSSTDLIYKNFRSKFYLSLQRKRLIKLDLGFSGSSVAPPGRREIHHEIEAGSMDAKRALLFVFLCCLSLSNCIHALSENTVGKHGKGIAEEKFTGSHTADHHDAPKVILFLFGTCMLGGKFWLDFSD